MTTLVLAQQMEGPIVLTNLTDAQIEETRSLYAGLDATTPHGYEHVRHAIAIVRNTRVMVEKKRVELKAFALDYGRRLDAEAKRLTTLILSIEDPLVAKKQAVDDENARKKAEVEAAKLLVLEMEIAANREKQEAEARAIRDAEEARLKAIRDAEDARLALERERLAVERAALAEERRQADVIKAKAQVDEDARVAAERVARDLARAEEEARVAAARAQLDRERREVEAARQAAERAEGERQAVIRAAQQVEADRLAAAERDARIQALLPDARKLDAFAAAIRALVPPSVKTKRAKAVLLGATTALEAIAAGLTAIDRQVV